MGANHSPALPLLAWLLHVGGPCTVCLSSPSEKSLPGTSVPLRATVGRPHSPTLWQVHSLSGSWPVMASHGPPPLPAPVLPGSPKFSGTVPTGNRCLILHTPWTVCCLLPFYPPSDFLCPGLSWRRPGTSPPSEGRELLGYCHCPNSPPVYPRQRGLQHQAQGPSRWPIKPSY